MTEVLFFSVDEVEAMEVTGEQQPEAEDSIRKRRAEAVAAREVEICLQLIS